MFPEKTPHGKCGRRDGPHEPPAPHVVSRAEHDAIADRVLLLEAALHHVCDRLGIDTHSLPDPLGSPLADELRRDRSPKSLDELVSLLTGAHERMDRQQEEIDMHQVALVTLGLDVPLPAAVGGSGVRTGLRDRTPGRGVGR
jgi:hypothetical protein